MELPECFLTATIADIEEKVQQISIHKAQVQDIQGMIARGIRVSIYDYHDYSKMMDEIREIDTYLKNVCKFLGGFGYLVTLESNGTVKIQSQGLDFHDYKHKYSEYGEVDNND